jgi:hypothetical protein
MAESRSSAIVIQGDDDAWGGSHGGGRESGLGVQRGGCCGGLFLSWGIERELLCAHCAPYLRPVEVNASGRAFTALAASDGVLVGSDGL